MYHSYSRGKFLQLICYFDKNVSWSYIFRDEVRCDVIILYHLNNWDSMDEPITYACGSCLVRNWIMKLA